MYVYIGGKSINVHPTQSIGQGGEAEIFQLDSRTVLKLYKGPDHPDYDGFPLEQEGARERLAEHQHKLPNFPKGLPSRVITPQDLATDGSGRIVGYTMRFLDNAEMLIRYTQKDFRVAVSNNQIVEIFRDLHPTFCGVHARGVVIGDSNDLNTLIWGLQAFLIDADSMQFSVGGVTYYCKLFTERFVDPMLCDPRATRLLLVKPHNIESDWYTFELELMQSLLFVGPYGGIYKPKNKALRIPHRQRPLKRITVFHPDVRYPKKAVPLAVLPDDLLGHFEAVFARDRRGAFPLHLLEELRWTKCTQCGTEHARAKCPVCTVAPPVAVTEVVRGEVVVTRVFTTSGTILHATVQGGKLRWLYHDGQNYRRGDKSIAFTGPLATDTRFRIQGKRTLIARGSDLITLSQGKVADRIQIGKFGKLPVFDTNAKARYWIAGGQLHRDGDLGPKYIGDILQNRTLFWVGPKFGFGFYRAGKMCVYFVFDAESRGINDSVDIPALRGQLIDSSAEFSKQYAWFFVATLEGGKQIHRCYVIRPDGTVKAKAEAEADDGSWLGERIRGNSAVGRMLFVATDDGLVRCEPQEDGTIVVTKRFPDAEPFVDSSTYLFATKVGIYTVKRREIRLITLRKKK